MFIGAGKTQQDLIEKIKQMLSTEEEEVNPTLYFKGKEVKPKH